MNQVKIRLFISSTFNDMDQERTLLHQYVFPRLEQLCESYGARFVAIDLRWGVNEHSQQNYQTMHLCLHELRRCQKESIKPNFIALVGNRYGWEPAPTHLKANDFVRICKKLNKAEKKELEAAYSLDLNSIPASYVPSPTLSLEEWYEKEQLLLSLLRKGTKLSKISPDTYDQIFYSATHQEIIQGLSCNKLDSDQSSTKHILACLREIDNLPETKSLFFDQKPERINELKSVLKKHLSTDTGGLGTSIYTYRAKLTPDQSSLLFDEQAFIEAVLNHLEPIVYEQVKEHYQILSSNEEEWQTQKRFCISKRKGFVGRLNERKQIHEHYSTSLKSVSRKPLAIIGGGGTGKSALIAQAIKDAQENRAKVFFKFAGGSPLSFDLLYLVRDLTQQFADSIPNSKSKQFLSDDYRDLLSISDSFSAGLKTLSTYHESTVIFVDALDQLTTPTEYLVTWLNYLHNLPTNVRLIFTALPHLRSILEDRCEIISLNAASDVEAKQALEGWLSYRQRTLTEEQYTSLVQLYRQSGEFLALRLLSLEAATWSSFTRVPKLPSTSEGLAKHFFKQLEYHHNPSKDGEVTPLVEYILASLVSARWGLTEEEVFKIVAFDDRFFSQLQSSSHHKIPAQVIPTVICSRLWYDLKSVLSAQSYKGETIYQFHHRLLADVAYQLYVEINRQNSYQRLKQYFEAQSNYVVNKLGQKIPNVRKLVELPNSLIELANDSSYIQYLTTFDISMTTLEADLLEQLTYDYSRAIHKSSASNANILENERKKLKAWDRFHALSLKLLKQGSSAWPIHRIFLQVSLEASDPLIRSVAQEWIEQGHCTWSFIHRLPFPAVHTTPNFRGLEGHTRIINGVQTIDNDHLLSWSGDHTLKLWNLTNESMDLELQGHTQPVLGTLLLSNKDLLVSWSSDFSIRLWSLSQGSWVHVLNGHQGLIYGVKELDHNLLLSWAADHTQRLWNLQTGVELRCVNAHTDEIVGVWSEDHQLISWSYDRSIVLWSSRSRKETKLTDHHEAVLGVIKLRNGDLISWSHDKTLKQWSIPSGSLVQTYRHHTASVYSAFEHSSGLLVSWGADHKICFWDSEEGELIEAYNAHTALINGVIELDSEQILSWSADHTLRLWNIAYLEQSICLTGHDREVVQAIQLSSGEILSWSLDYQIIIWNETNTQMIHRFDGHKSLICDVIELTPSIYCSWEQSPQIYFWDRNKCKPLVIYELPSTVIEVIKLSESNIIIYCEHGDLYLSSIPSPQTDDISEPSNTSLLSHHNLIYKVMRLKGGRILSWSTEGLMCLWDNDNGQLLNTMSGHTGANWTKKALSGGHIISYSTGNIIVIWDSQTGEPIKNLESETGRIKGILELKDKGLCYWSAQAIYITRNYMSKEVLTLPQEFEKIKSVIEVKPHLILVFTDQIAMIWDIDSSSLLFQCSTPTEYGEIKSCIPLNLRSFIIQFDQSADLFLWQPYESKQSISLQAHGEVIYSVLAHEYGFVSVSTDGQITIWSSHGQVLNQLYLENFRSLRIAELDHEKYLLVNDQNNFLLIDSHTGQSYIMLLSFFPDSMNYFLVNHQRWMILWNESQTYVWDSKYNEENTPKRMEHHSQMENYSIESVYPLKEHYVLLKLKGRLNDKKYTELIVYNCLSYVNHSTFELVPYSQFNVYIQNDKIIQKSHQEIYTWSISQVLSDAKYKKARIQRSSVFKQIETELNTENIREVFPIQFGFKEHVFRDTLTLRSNEQNWQWHQSGEWQVIYAYDNPSTLLVIKHNQLAFLRWYHPNGKLCMINFNQMIVDEEQSKIKSENLNSSTIIQPDIWNYSQNRVLVVAPSINKWDIGQLNTRWDIRELLKAKRFLINILLAVAYSIERKGWNEGNDINSTWLRSEIFNKPLQWFSTLRLAGLAGMVDKPSHEVDYQQLTDKNISRILRLWLPSSRDPKEPTVTIIIGARGERLFKNIIPLLQGRSIQSSFIQIPHLSSMRSYNEFVSIFRQIQDHLTVIDDPDLLKKRFRRATMEWVTPNHSPFKILQSVKAEQFERTEIDLRLLSYKINSITRKTDLFNLAMTILDLNDIDQKNELMKKLVNSYSECKQWNDEIAIIIQATGYVSISDDTATSTHPYLKRFISILHRFKHKNHDSHQYFLMIEARSMFDPDGLLLVNHLSTWLKKTVGEIEGLRLAFQDILSQADQYSSKDLAIRTHNILVRMDILTYDEDTDEPSDEMLAEIGVRLFGKNGLTIPLIDYFEMLKGFLPQESNRSYLQN